MTEITPFTFPTTGQAVRLLTVAGEPWFLANDVCAVLDIANVGNALARLDEDEKSSIRLADGTPGNPNRALISEPGLYALVVRSDKPEARTFRRWVTHEVLPAIRRTGSYSVAETYQVPRTLPEALRAYAAEVEAHEQTRAALTEAAPKADAWDTLAEAHGDYSLREAAQILNRDPLITTGQNRLARHLKKIGWADKTGQPYQAQVDAGRLVRRSTSYEHPRTGEREATCQIRVTVKGLKELRRRMAGQQQLVVIDGGAA